MKVLYFIKAPKWDNDQIPYKEVETFRFVKEAETFETCDEDALKFFNQYIKRPENGWDYLKLEKHLDGKIRTIDHTCWLVNSKTTSA